MNARVIRTRDVPRWCSTVIGYLVAALVIGSDAVGAWALDDADTEALKTLLEAESVHRWTPEDIATVLSASTAEVLNARLQQTDPYAELRPAPRRIERAYRWGLELMVVEGDVWAVPRTAAKQLPTGLAPFMLLRVNRQSVDERSRRSPQAIANMLGLPSTAARADLVYALADGARHQVRIEAHVPRDLSPTASGYDMVPTPAGLSIRVLDFVHGETRAGVSDYLFRLERVNQREAILDLRFAEGGDLYEAFDVASLFLARNAPALARRERTGEITVFRAPRAGVWSERPVSVLVSDRTASAAEALVRALGARGSDTTRIIGAPTFGKCYAQGVFVLPSGAELVLSVFELLDPISRRPCEGQPVLPNRALSTPPLMDPRRWGQLLLHPQKADVAPAPGTVIQGVARDGQKPPRGFVCSMPAFADRRGAAALQRLLVVAIELDNFVPVIMPAVSEGGWRVCIGPLGSDVRVDAMRKRLGTLFDTPFEAHEVLR